MSIARLLRLLLVVLSTIASVTFARSALAIERNFAGSAQLNYMFVPTAKHGSARDVAFDGFTTELSLKAAIDVSDRLSANAKVCFACHGFELGMAHFDYRVADELSFRVGRFSPSFGAFNLRHDPANHRLSDKPLPYDMGRMLRMIDWNLGVLPSPFPDNGLEISGMHWFGDTFALDWAAYAVSGFKGDTTSVDIDFKQSRTPGLYYVDNNSRPTVGARLAATKKLFGESDLTFGASGMYGTYDPDNKRAYLILGADFTLRVHRTNVRLEWLARRQQMDTSDPERFKFVVPPSGGDFSVKHGAYLEIEQPVSPAVDIIGRFDGMYRVGNVLAASTLSRESTVLRWTLGTAITVERALKIKASAEAWSFSDPDARNRKNEISLNLGLVGTL